MPPIYYGSAPFALKRGSQALNLYYGSSLLSGNTYDADSVTLFAAMTVQPDATRKAAIDTYIKALKACGAWAKMDRLWVLAAHDKNAALLNWKNPAVDPLVLTISGAVGYWTTDRGFNGNGTTTVGLKNSVGLSTLVADGAAQFKQTNAHVSVWVRDAQQYMHVMAQENVTRLGLIPRNGASGVHFGINSTALGVMGTTSTTNYDGLWSVHRKVADGASRQYLFRNGAAYASNGAPADGGDDDVAFTVGTPKLALIKTNTESASKVSLCSIGSDISAEAPAYYAATVAYMTAVGVIRPPVASSWAFDFTTTPSIYSASGNFYPTAQFAEATLFPDHEGLLRSTVANEVSFGGYRRVKNFITGSDTGTTQTATVVVGREYVLSFTGTGSIAMTGAATATLTGQGASTRVAKAKVTATTTSLVMTVTGDVRFAQLEDVTNQANQNPSEYVSNGSLPDPYHGCNVDGIKYFMTANGNTVAGEVVTEATGSALTTLKGLQIMPATTNLVIQSNNLAAWTAVATPTITSAAKHCGDVYLDLVGDDDGAGLEGYTRAVTYTGNGQKGVSFLISKGTATSSVVRIRDTTAAADRALVAITWTGSVPTATISTGELQKVQALGNGVYRVMLLTASVTAANAHLIEVYPATDAALSTAATGDVYVGGFQSENFDFSSMLIPTAAATVARTEQKLYSTTIKSGSNAGLNDTAGTVKAEVYFEIDCGNATAIQQYLWNIQSTTLTNSRHMAVRYPDKFISCQMLYENVQQNYPFVDSLWENDKVLRIAYAYGASGANLDSAAAITDGPLSTLSIAGQLPTGLTSITMGSGGGPDHALNGYLRKFSYSPTRASNADLQAYL